MKSSLRFAVAAVTLLWSACCFAQLPLTVQGSLRDSGGNPVNGSTNLGFSIFTTQAGGSALWTEAHPGVNVTNGIYAAQLGTITPFPAALFTGNAGTLYLQITVGTNSPMVPRQKLQATAVANAVADNGVTAQALQSGVVTSAKLATELKTAFRAYMNTNLLISPDTLTKLTFPAVTINDGAGYNGGVSTFTAPSSGTYEFTGRVSIFNTGGSGVIRLYLYKNGVVFSTLSYSSMTSTSGALSMAAGTEFIQLTAGDTVELYMNISTTTMVAQGAGAQMTVFSGKRLY